MLASFVGSIVASVYSSRPIKGYNLPLLSNATSYTRYTVVIGAAIKMHLSGQISDKNTIKCLKVYSGENLQKNIFELKLMPLDFVISSMVLGCLSDSFLLTKDFFSDIQKDKLVLNSTEGLIKAINLLKNNESPDTALISLESHFPNINKIDLEKNRVSLSNKPLSETIEMAVHIGLTAVDFDDALRRCLYVGGNFDALMIIAATITNLVGNKTSPELKLFCKNYLSQNTPELFNLAFNRN